MLKIVFTEGIEAQVQALTMAEAERLVRSRYPAAEFQALGLFEALQPETKRLFWKGWVSGLPPALAVGYIQHMTLAKT